MNYIWTNGDLITADRLNSMGYDLVLSVPLNDYAPENVSVVYGNILECEQKIADGEAVNAILLLTYEWSYIPSTANMAYGCHIAKLTHWSGGYCWMTFSEVFTVSSELSSSIVLSVHNLVYDPDDGTILSINNPYKQLT